MKQFFSFVKKEFYHVFRDSWTMVILLLMPVVQMILFGFAISTEIRNINVAIVAPEHDELTQMITDKLDAVDYFTVNGYFTSMEKLDEAFRQGDIDCAILFGQAFEENLYSADGSSICLSVDASNSNTATTMAMYAQSIISDCIKELSPYVGAAGIAPDIKMLYNPQMKSSFNFVPGLMGLIIILICAMMTSVSIVREKEKGTMELLLVSPVKPLTIVISKMVPYMVMSFVNYLTILLLATTLLGVPVAGSFLTLSLLSLIYIITALALGLLISSATQSQLVAMIGSGMVLMIPVLFFSGLLFPVEGMPKVFQYFSWIVPARWYVTAAKKLMIQGLSFRYVLQEFIILSIMAVLFITISLKSFKNRLS